MPVLISWGDAGIHHFAGVDPGGRPAEVEGGQGEAWVLPQGDMLHLMRIGNGVLGCAAYELDDGRGSPHGKAADPGCLGDGAVAQVQGGVGRSEAGKIQSFNQGRGRGEPAVAGAAQADAELDPVARHHRDHAAVRHTVSGIQHGLAGRHRDIQEEMVVPGDEFQDGSDDIRREICPQQGRRQTRRNVSSTIITFECTLTATSPSMTGA